MRVRILVPPPSPADFMFLVSSLREISADAGPANAAVKAIAAAKKVIDFFIIRSLIVLVASVEYLFAFCGRFSVYV